MPSLTDSIGRVLGDRYRLVTALGTGASPTSTWPTTSPFTAGWPSRCSTRLWPATAPSSSASRPRRRPWPPSTTRTSCGSTTGGGGRGALPGARVPGGRHPARGLRHRRLLTPEQAVHVGARGRGRARLRPPARAGPPRHQASQPPVRCRAAAEDRRLRAGTGAGGGAWTEPDGAILGPPATPPPSRWKAGSWTARRMSTPSPSVLYEGMTGEAAFIGDTTVATLMARVGALLPEHEALGPAGRCAGLGRRPRSCRALQRGPAGGRELERPVRQPSRRRPLCPLVGTIPPMTGRAETRARTAGATSGARPSIPAGAGTGPSSVPRAPTQRAADPRGADGPRRSPVTRRGRGVGGVVARRPGAVADSRRRGLGPRRPGSSPPAIPCRQWSGRRWQASAQAAPDHFTVRTEGPRPSITVGRRDHPEPAAAPRPGGGPVTAKQGSIIDGRALDRPAARRHSGRHLVHQLQRRHPGAQGRPPGRGVPRRRRRSTARRWWPAQSSDPPAGSAPYGSTVTIVTSKGHAPGGRPTGRRARLDVHRRRRGLTAAGFVPAKGQAYTATVPAGPGHRHLARSIAGLLPYGSQVPSTSRSGPSR